MRKEKMRSIISKAVIYPKFKHFFFKQTNKAKKKFSLSEDQYKEICDYIKEYSFIFEVEQAKTQAFAL